MCLNGKHVHDQTAEEHKVTSGFGTAMFFEHQPKRGQKLSTALDISYREAADRFQHSYGFKWVPHVVKSYADLVRDAGDCEGTPCTFSTGGGCPGSCYCSNKACYSILGSGEAGGGGPCLAADTPVLMGDESWKDISLVSVGDNVLWFDHISEERGVAPVEAVRVSHNQKTWRFEFDNKSTMCTTAAHRFFRVHDPNPVEASALAIGDRIPSLNGSVKIENIAPTGRLETVYHLSLVGGRPFVAGIVRTPFPIKH